MTRSPTARHKAHQPFRLANSPSCFRGLRRGPTKKFEWHRPRQASRPDGAFPCGCAPGCWLSGGNAAFHTRSARRSSGQCEPVHFLGSGPSPQSPSASEGFWRVAGPGPLRSEERALPSFDVLRYPRRTNSDFNRPDNSSTVARVCKITIPPPDTFPTLLP
jgi:hypothetical protein